MYTVCNVTLRICIYVYVYTHIDIYKRKTYAQDLEKVSMYVYVYVCMYVCMYIHKPNVKRHY